MGSRRLGRLGVHARAGSPSASRGRSRTSCTRSHRAIRRGPRKRGLRSPATPKHGTFGNAIHHSCKFRATGPRALYQLCLAERRGATVQSHQDKYCRLAQRRHPCRAPTGAPIHFRSSLCQRIRPGYRPFRLRRRVPGQAGSPMSIDTAFRPRSLTASEYVRELFEPTDNAAILVRNRATGKTVQRITKAETIASPEFQAWLAARSAAGSDVYVGMNPIKEGACSRTKENIKNIRHVYLDLDKNGDKSLETIRNSTQVPPPNFVLDTSPGKHQIVWKVSGFSQDGAESLLHNLANQFAGDLAATDSTRVLRLPGFANRKLSEEFIVQARQESDAIHTLRDFTIHEDSPETPRHLVDDQERLRKMPGDHKSQSERDWAYAKRALARGDEPELVIQRIADYRATDKPQPEYYARHTVTKALADLGKIQLNSEPTLDVDGEIKFCGYP